MKTRPYNFSVRAQDAENYTISIRGVIGTYVDYNTWSMSDTEADVLNELSKIPEGKQIAVHINSRGGDVGLGLGIYNALKRRSKDITTYNDGYAMSAASIALLAGARRVCPTGSITMIHRAQGGADGTSSDLQTMSEGLAVIDGMMAKVYAEVSGKKTAAEFLEMMTKTTWCDGERALELGLATTCEGELPENDEDDITDAERKIIAVFEKTVPENLRARVLPKAAAPRAEHQAGDPAAKTNKTQIKSMKKITAALVAAGYNVAIDAEEDAVLAQVTALISDRANLKTSLTGHETALKNRVTAKVEKAITDKLVKTERKDALIKAGIADETMLDFIDDLRADAATHRPRAVNPARRTGEEQADDTETQLGENVEIIHAAETSPAKRSELCRASLKLRGLDGIVKKHTETRTN